ncbi:tight junction protein ZO-1 isoform X3 [Zeugodacus cucurbitae]|uniref:tight junction protein ZO-1 isoform X3 n=1 Tax=Zeugodacus cucurbitae TaxID=28588 RepID=UPI0023D8FF14|nr:tight junction protein ZO-1 isoform X3 [Zeugodacus cucurbitae]
MSREEEEEEVRSLLLRHKDRIILDLCETDLLTILVKNSVLTQSEEDLLLKTYSTASAPSSAPPSAVVIKRKLSTAVSSGSGSSSNTVTSYGDGVVGEEGCSSAAGCSSSNSRSASVIGDNAQSDNRSVTPSLVNISGTDGNIGTRTDQSENNCDEDLKLNVNSLNDADIYEEQSKNLIEIIAKGGFIKFKQFCYAIDNECPKLIEDLFNDKAKCDAAVNNTSPCEDKIQKELEPIEYIDKEKENDRSRRAVSYGGTSHDVGSLPRAAPRRISLMKEPPPPPPPKPAQLMPVNNDSGTPLLPSKYEQSDYNLIQKVDSNSGLTTTAQYQLPNFYVNARECTEGYAMTNNSNNYSSLLCHGNSASSPTAVRKREKLLHRFSDAATLGRKLKKKKNTNRTCRSMTEAIEMLADPVIEDEFFGDRTTWEYHTVSVTRVPGYGFGIAVSGGRDNPHFANGDPSIAVSDVLKGGPAEDRLQVNDRIISVNGVSLENVEYATAVQVLRDSGNTVALVVKRRVPISAIAQNHHSHSMSSVGMAASNVNGAQIPPASSIPNTMSQSNSTNTAFVQNNTAQPIKVTLSKGNKKEDYGIVLGCRLFIKEISTKARDQLTANGYSLQEGDVITRIHNTNCGDTMNLKEAKKIIDGCKERLNLVVLRDITNQAVTAMTNQLNNSATQSNLYVSHQAQISNCSNNLDDPYLGGANYSSQNLYVQPPTRSMMNGVTNGLNDEKSNLTPRGRSRGPIMDGVSLSQLDRPVTPPNGNRTRTDEPPRPPPPRGSGNGSTEDFYGTRRQIFESEQLSHPRQSSEPRFISFQKEGSVGIRLTGGNESGIFVTAVQPGSPASLQGLAPGDKILKVNDMDMHGVTREEAVLFLLSLQDRIDLIVQFCKEEYDEVVTNQRGDSFHIKTHFHCDNPSKGEMPFKAGDVFRVIDTLHNGVVGSWQVLKIGRGHQEMQRGVIPNKSRAEELATAQFNANKKEMNSNESRGNFFRRRRSTHRRSKSLSRENWDDVVFADSISKFPAYERVVLRHPGFVRPLVLFGPISDLAREKLAKDFADKFSVPLQDDDKSNSKCRIVRLSNIRDIMDRGKHALLDITPNAVDRLNYAQFYPIVIFLKTDSKHVIKQLRHGLPKSAHKSSKKLLEQCQKLERIWSHIFSTQIVLNDEESWYRKLRDAIDLQQSGAVWMSESKVPYEHAVNAPTNRRQTIDANKYETYATRSSMIGASGGVSDPSAIPSTRPQSLYGIHAPDLPPRIDRQSKPGLGEIPPPSRTNSSGGTLGRSAQERLFGKAIVSDDVQAEYISRNVNDSIDRQHSSLERQALLNAAISGQQSIGQKATQPNASSYDSMSSYDSYNASQLTVQNLGRLGPNAPDDLKSVPNANRPLPPVGVSSQGPDYARTNHDHRSFQGSNDLNRQSSPARATYHEGSTARNIDSRSGQLQRPSNLGLENSPRKPIVETKTDYGKYSRNNSVTQADYNKLPKNPHIIVPTPNINSNSSNGPSTNGTGPFKPVPPPKPKNYRPPMQGGNSTGGQWENVESSSPRSPNGFFYPPMAASHHHYSQQTPGSPGHGNNTNNNMQPTYSSAGNYAQQSQYPPPPVNGYVGNHHYNGGSGTGPYIAPHRGMPAPIGNIPSHNPERNPLDLAGSREQRGSAFELYRKPQIGTTGHHHNMSEMAPYEERFEGCYSMSPPPPPPGHPSSRSMSSYSNQIAPPQLPPNHDSDYYIYQMRPEYSQMPQQCYVENCMPPPLPPHKVKKKSVLKSPLVAIKNAFIKTTKPLRRMNSMVEPEQKPKSSIKRQHSMLERGMQRPYYPDEYPTYPAGFEDRYYHGPRRSGMPSNNMMPREQYFTQQYDGQYHYDLVNSTYQNLESEDIYGNMGTVPRMHRGLRGKYETSGHEDLYANRAFIDLERRQAEAMAAANRNGRKIIRRHSTTTADRMGSKRPTVGPSNGSDYNQGVYQSKVDVYNPQNQRRAPNSEVMARRHFYSATTNEIVEPTYEYHRELTRDIRRNQPNEFKKETHERINKEKQNMEQGCSSRSSSQSERDEKSDRESIYQSRREVKDSALKTRAQLREQIYQTRREALDSMAEPIYVSRKKDTVRPEPIYETKEESILQSHENETDEKKEEKTDCNNFEPDQRNESLSRSDLQKSSDTVIENTVIQSHDPPTAKAPIVKSEDVDDDLDGSDNDEATLAQLPNNELKESDAVMKTLTNESRELSDEVFETLNLVTSPLVVEGPPIKALEPPQPTKCVSTRPPRAPFHISNILKRTGPPPTAAISDSRTSLETQYTSQASLPVGPPKASSTPYTSNMSLPIAGPVPTTAPPVATTAATGAFPIIPREPTTTRGIFDSNGGTLADAVWNVSLQIPPGAIPTGVRQEIYFTVSDPRLGEAVGGPPLDMENGETMLSPLVMCGPQGLEFLVPVTLNIPHCAGRTASLGLALKATDSEKNLHTEWDNIDLPSNAAAHTVSVKVDHF